MTGMTVSRFIPPAGCDAVRARRAGCAGAVLAALGSYGTGALSITDPTRHWPVLGLLRHGAGQRIALVLVYAGVAVLLLSWLYLGRAIRRGEEQTDLRSLLITCAWWAGPLVLSVPLFSRDVWSYAAQAHLTASGLDPYRAGPDQLPGPYLDEVQRVWVDSPAPYGPLWLFAGRLVAMAGSGHVYVTMECVRLLSASGVLLLARYLPRLARACGVDPRGTVWLALANPLLLVHFVSGGHNDALMLGFGIMGLALVAEGSPVAGIAVATLGIAIKAPIVLVLPFAVPLWAARIHRPHAWWRATGLIAAVALPVFALVTLVSRLGLGWLGQLATPGSVRSWVSIPTGLALLGGALGRLLGAGDHTDQLVSAFRLSGQIVSGGLCVLLWLRTRDPADPLRRGFGPVGLLGIGLLALVAFGPIVQPWYALWPIVVLAAAGLSGRTHALVAGISIWLALLVTPQGATLFNRPVSVLVAALAAVVATVGILGRLDPRPAPPSADGADAVPVDTVARP